MSTLIPISLDTDWVCDYFELEPSLYEFMDGIPLPSLHGWRPERRYDEGWAVWLQKTFDLTSTDVCVNYKLIIESAPHNTVVYLNGTQVGTFVVRAPVVVDVTDVITLEDNVIAFRVVCGGGGSFGTVSLHPIPCD